ncbi:UNVERIFIED_CONTAM: hypothetical protein PYX00_007905 [Menopon gallinae]|uniref:Syntaxin-18 n=1 Tax=Menopon gallinae TaxID=328185 RepID=A0AAW2HKN0_9NEOP
MDITILFKACIKTIKTRNRAIGDTTLESDKSKLLSPRHGKCEFTMRSNEIVQQITLLRDFLYEHRKAYLNFASRLSDLPEMSDFERDKIDSGAQRIINRCSNFIGEFEKELLKKNNESGQKSKHQQIVIELMKEYLKQVCKVYSEQRAIRVQRSVEMKKMSRINSNSPKKVNPTETRKPNVTEDVQSSFPENDSLSPEELQMFELENNQLYNELNCITDEITQLENKVVKIAELQEILTEKVLEQDKDIDWVAATVIGTTENVKDANEQIRRAIQGNAGLRVWILFFLLVISFSLLFLDWYNG